MFEKNIFFFVMHYQKTASLSSISFFRTRLLQNTYYLKYIFRNIWHVFCFCLFVCLFVFFLRYVDEENRNVEAILINEVRGNFGKKKWPKAEIKGKSCIFPSFLNLAVSRCCGQVQSSNETIQKIEKTLKFPKNKSKPIILLATPRNTLKSLSTHLHI